MVLCLEMSRASSGYFFLGPHASQETRITLPVPVQQRPSHYSSTFKPPSACKYSQFFVGKDDLIVLNYLHSDQLLSQWKAVYSGKAAEVHDVISQYLARGVTPWRISSTEAMTLEEFRSAILMKLLNTVINDISADRKDKGGIFYLVRYVHPHYPGTYQEDWWPAAQVEGTDALLAFHSRMAAANSCAYR